MRRDRRFWVAAVLLASNIAYGETPEALEAKGEAFAKDGRFSEAIDAFKAADKLQPRASHVCLIALAYTRRELWPQAEIFLDKCHQRATAEDPLPGWVGLADKQLQQRLADANVAAVTITVEPDVPATLAVSSFAPDETFGPRTIHLAPGRHAITVEAAGFESAQQTIEVADRTDKRVVIPLHKLGAVIVDTSPRPPPHPPKPVLSPSKVPWIVMGAGGAIALAGLGVHVFMLEPVRANLQDAHDHNNRAEYDDNSKKFDNRLTATLVLYGVGAAAIAAGVALKYTVFKHDEVSVALAPTSGGAMLAFGWRR